MKGIVFTEFLEMVESKFGLHAVDTIIEESNLPNKGAYTAVGTYNHKDIIKMVDALSKIAKSPIRSLIRVFGQHLASIFARKFPDFFAFNSNVFDFLKSVDGYIHVEVRKLYPDAELPKFSFEQPTPDQLVFDYQSERPLADLAQGLIEGCIKHFGEKVKLECIDQDNGENKKRRFIITREQ